MLFQRNFIDVGVTSHIQCLIYIEIMLSTYQLDINQAFTLNIRSMPAGMCLFLYLLQAAISDVVISSLASKVDRWWVVG